MTAETRPLGVSAPAQRFFRELGFPFVLAVMFVGIFIIRQPGADFSHYVDWARAFRHADILALDLDGIWSPVNVPLSQWQFGTGLVYSLSGFFGPADLLAFPAIISCIGLLFFFLTLRRVTREPFVAIIFFCLAWIATPLGYYTFAQSSESLAAAFLSIYFYLITSPSRRTLGHYFLCGIAGGLVISTRTQLAVWVAAGVPLLVAEYSARKTNGLETRLRALASLVAFCIPLIASVAAIQVINRWMTGSALLSPYVFGDAQFQSVDILNPHLLAVLFHPWHGLLVYHPFFLIPLLLLGASVISFLRGRFSVQTIFAATVFAAFGLQLWLQSAWYCWWLGTDTFGMRAFAPATVPVLIAAAPLYEKALQGSTTGGFRLPGAMTGVSLVAAAWSGLLMTQGATNFLTFTTLLEGQAYALWILLSAPSALLAAAIAIAITWLVFGRSGSTTESPGRGPALLLITGALFVLLRDILAREGVISIVALLVAAVLLVQALRHLGSWLQPGARQRLVQAACLLLAGGWIFSQIIFGRLAIPVESRLQPNPDGQTFYVREVMDTYREYLEVSGFEDEKRALAEFLSGRTGAPAGLVDHAQAK